MKLGPVDEAELVTAAVADLQRKRPGAIVERVEIIDLDEIKATGWTCDQCGVEIPVAFFIRRCDACIEASLPSIPQQPDRRLPKIPPNKPQPAPKPKPKPKRKRGNR